MFLVKLDFQIIVNMYMIIAHISAYHCQLHGLVSSVRFFKISVRK